MFYFLSFHNANAKTGEDFNELLNESLFRTKTQQKEEINTREINDQIKKEQEEVTSVLLVHLIY